LLLLDVISISYRSVAVESLAIAAEALEMSSPATDSGAETEVRGVEAPVDDLPEADCLAAYIESECSRLMRT
jgi:hypothetical protein